MKKKALVCIIVGILVLSLGTASAFAASESPGNQSPKNCDLAYIPYFVDDNGDTIWDNRNEDVTRFQDEAAGNDDTAYGICWTDQDGDGICDRFASGNACPQNGTGWKNGPAGNGQGTGYVDNDNDGVCDNRAENTARSQNEAAGNDDTARGICWTDQDLSLIHI